MPNNNTLQVFQTEPDELTLAIVMDGSDPDHEFDSLSVTMFSDDLENLILNLTFKLASMKGYTQDMFNAPAPLQPIAPEGEGTPKTYKPHYLGGRCFNGAHRDAGKVIHAVKPLFSNGSNFNKAACGKVPGLRSYGWVEDTNSAITCRLCLRKLMGYSA